MIFFTHLLVKRKYIFTAIEAISLLFQNLLRVNIIQVIIFQMYFCEIEITFEFPIINRCPSSGGSHSLCCCEAFLFP